jgi:hypothetical protein
MEVMTFEVMQYIRVNNFFVQCGVYAYLKTMKLYFDFKNAQNDHLSLKMAVIFKKGAF